VQSPDVISISPTVSPVPSSTMPPILGSLQWRYSRCCTHCEIPYPINTLVSRPITEKREWNRCANPACQGKVSHAVMTSLDENCILRIVPMLYCTCERSLPVLELLAFDIALPDILPRTEVAALVCAVKWGRFGEYRRRFNTEWVAASKSN
jgi:hypothetical protein